MAQRIVALPLPGFAPGGLRIGSSRRRWPGGRGQCRARRFPLSIPKNRGPDHRVPVISRAIIDSDRQRLPCHSNPSSSTSTVMVWPCHSRTSLAPWRSRTARLRTRSPPSDMVAASSASRRVVPALSPPWTCSWIFQATPSSSSSRPSREGGSARYHRRHSLRSRSASICATTASLAWSSAERLAASFGAPPPGPGCAERAASAGASCSWPSFERHGLRPPRPRQRHRAAALSGGSMR